MNTLEDQILSNHLDENAEYISFTPRTSWAVYAISKGLWKVLGSSGLNEWRINSGIKSITEHEDFYDIHGFSGSTYRCYKDRYGIPAYGRHIHDLLEVGYLTEKEFVDLVHKKFAG